MSEEATQDIKNSDFYSSLIAKTTTVATSYTTSGVEGSYSTSEAEGQKFVVTSSSGYLTYDTDAGVNENGNNNNAEARLF